ncbi:MAG: cupin domain-containing protein [Flavobacteriales bacterium]|nr:cupin domain-containing protein [Flavobacteriales bacterium]
MAILYIPSLDKEVKSPQEIQQFLNERGVFFDQWEASCELRKEATQDEVLSAYHYVLEPYMIKNGYKTADVINIYPGIENYDAIRAKFLAEHTHSEDEVRFFVEGEGLFWFNIEGSDVFHVRCQAGDLISVPKGAKHWFDAGEIPNVKAIRIFIDMSGWIPQYTQSGIESEFKHISI